MLRKITVKQFKSLVDLDLELGRINLFIGANGSGKSNILEAVGVLGAAANGRVDDEALLRRGVRPSVPALYKSAFPSTPTSNRKWHISLGAESGNNASYDITIWNPIGNSNWLFKTESLKLRDHTLASRSPRSSRHELNPEQGIAALKTVELKHGDAALELMNQLREYRIHCPNTSTLRSLIPDIQNQEPVGLAGGRLPEAVAELVEFSKKNSEFEEALEEVLSLIDWAKGFSAVSPVGVPLSPSAARSRLVIQFVDRYMNKNKEQNKLTGYDASEGALYVLFCAVLALHPRSPRCFAVDNVDQALNPRLARRLLAAICRWTKQLNGDRQWLMTAHNPAVLDDLPLDDDEVRLFTVDRNNKGYTEVRRIDVAKAIEKRPNQNWTLSRMWMEGYLGGVPNV